MSPDEFRRLLKEIASELTEEQKAVVAAYAELYIASFLSDEVTPNQALAAFVDLSAKHEIPLAVVMKIKAADDIFPDFSA